MKRWTVTHNDVSKRIDIFLNEHSELSRTKLNEMIKSQAVRCNGESIKAKYKLKLHDVIEIDDFIQQTHNLDGVSMDLDIVYEDSYLCVLNKPKGMLTHPGKHGDENTLLHGLIHHFKDKKPGIVHRLDKDTEGLLVVAKDAITHAHLSKQVESKSMKRYYYALVHGVLDKETIVESAIGSHKFEKKMSVDGINARPAKTLFTPVQKGREWSLLHCELFTGRTHQIRVHAQSLGHPLIEDPVYGIDSDAKGQYLFAYKLHFTHPHTLEEMIFEQAYPQSFIHWIGDHQ